MGQSVGDISTGGSGGGRDPDAEVEFIGSDSFKITFTEELLDLINLLSKMEVKKFTFEEAKAEIRRFGCPFEGRANYKKTCIAIDPRFHTAPYTFYADEGWVDWGDYLGKDKTRSRKKFTFEEAKAEIRRLGCPFEGRTNYKKTCIGIDPRFHTTPHTLYVNEGWVDWDNYLGKDKG